MSAGWLTSAHRGRSPEVRLADGLARGVQLLEAFMAARFTVSDSRTVARLRQKSDATGDCLIVCQLTYGAGDF
jgi:hypothetical protein